MAAGEVSSSFGFMVEGLGSLPLLRFACDFDVDAAHAAASAAQYVISIS